jgi:class 3 adenylate cyclase
VLDHQHPSLSGFDSSLEAKVTGENPYYHRGPIRQSKYFCDRVRETALALQMIKNGQCVSVIGPRRIGKTSFLFHLLDSAVKAENGLTPEEMLLIYLDGEMLGGLSKWDILEVMLQETVAQSENTQLGGMAPIVNYRSFEQALRQLTKPRQQLVYLIDEFDCLGKCHNLDIDFFSFLRSLTVRYSISYVTASQTPLLAFIDGKGQLSSSFFNVFMSIHLGLFSEDHARQMIQKPLQAVSLGFSKDMEDFIFDLAGPHPFFLQVTCYHAFELSRESLSFGEQERKQLAERVRGDLECHFEYFTSRLSEEERRVLVQVLDNEPGQALAPTLEELERKCLIHQSAGKYKLVSHAFARFIRDKIGTSWAASIAEGDRRMATVLFVDMVGFTPMTEQHIPEDIFSIVKPVLQMFVNVADRHGGQIAAFGGDSVMALFGVPTEQSDDAIRAVHAALEIQDNVVTYARELKENKGIDFAARVGVATGVVVVGKIGGEQRAEYTALGDAVNLACRLESLAQPGAIVISHPTYQQVRGHFKIERLGSVEVKGKARPVRAYRVMGKSNHEG